jgi:hypothetical protein
MINVALSSNRASQAMRRVRRSVSRVRNGIFDVLRNLLRIFAVDRVRRVRYMITRRPEVCAGQLAAAACESCMRDLPARMVSTASQFVSVVAQ